MRDGWKWSTETLGTTGLAQAFWHHGDASVARGSYPTASGDETPKAAAVERLQPVLFASYWNSHVAKAKSLFVLGGFSSGSFASVGIVAKGVSDVVRSRELQKILR
jgi:hypothetical protein